MLKYERDMPMYWLHMQTIYHVTIAGDDYRHYSARKASHRYDTAVRQGIPAMIHVDGDCLAASGFTARINWELAARLLRA